IVAERRLARQRGADLTFSGGKIETLHKTARHRARTRNTDRRKIVGANPKKVGLVVHQHAKGGATTERPRFNPLFHRAGRSFYTPNAAHRGASHIKRTVRRRCDALGIGAIAWQCDFACFSEGGRAEREKEK